MAGTAELFQFGGELPNKPGKNSARARGIKQGTFIFLIGLLLFPILGMLSVFVFRVPPWPAGMALFLTAGGGLLRIAYALMFEQNFPKQLPGGTEFDNAALKISAQRSATALPPQQTYATDDYVTPRTGKWLDTNDLEPRSVTEGTTKLLENETDLPGR